MNNLIDTFDNLMNNKNSDLEIGKRMVIYGQVYVIEL
jgi:hypothetical protein